MYQVTHYEKYVYGETVKEYESLEEMKETYSVFWKYVEKELSALKTGEQTGVRYDDYINLSVEKVS